MLADDATQERDAFLDCARQAFVDGQLQRLLFSKYVGEDAELARISVRPVAIKGVLMLSFGYEYRSRHITHNHALDEALALWRQWLGVDFKNAHLFTDSDEWQLSFSKKGRAQLHRQVRSVTANAADKAVAAGHNREKQRHVDQSRPWLQALGVTDARGQIIPAMARKWKQINKFIEVLSGAIESSALGERKNIRVADFGSGKAYLTFAVHDYLSTQLGVQAEVIGVELRQPLVDLCNDTARQLGLHGLRFEQGDVQHFAAQGIDIMIALHACDTATDHALHMGIRCGAEIILSAPCCHKEVRPQLQSPPLLQPLLKHGVHLGQEAEMITDGLRSLLLEAQGYDTQVFEFISLEHTSKNKMILARKRKQSRDNKAVLEQIAAIKDFYGIEMQSLETLLQKSSGALETH